MENSFADQFKTLNENIFNEEWEKLVNKLFGSKELMLTNYIFTILVKTYPNYYEIDIDNIKAYDTKFSWGDIIRAIESQGISVTKNELHDELKKNIIKK